MPAQLFYMPFLPAFTSRGLPAGGASAAFYLSGTTTFASIYSDGDLTTRLPNPITADGLGRFPDIYLEENQTYRVRILDAQGAQIGADIDPYYPGQAVTNVADLPELVAPDGAAKVGFSQPEPTAVGRTVLEKSRETISVRDYPDARDAIIKLQGKGGGKMQMPPGIYPADLLQIALSAGVPILIEGAGVGVSVIRKNTDSNDAALTLDVTGATTNYTVLRNLSIDNGFRGAGGTRSNRNGTGLRLVNCAEMAFDGIQVSGFDTNIDCQGGLVNLWSGCSSFEGNTGLRFDRSATNIYSNRNIWTGGAIKACRIGIDAVRGDGNTFEGTDIEHCGIPGDNTTGAVALRGTLADEGVSSIIHFTDCHFEANSGRAVIFGATLPNVDVIVNKSKFIGNTDGKDFDVWDARRIMLIDNVCPSPASVVRLRATGQSMLTGFYSGVIDGSPEFFHHYQGFDGIRNSASSSFRVRHINQPPTTADLLIGSTRSLVGEDNEDDMILKYGLSKLRVRMGNTEPLRLSQTGISFNGADPVAQGAAIMNPSDPATTQSALISLLTYLRSRGDIAPNA